MCHKAENRKRKIQNYNTFHNSQFLFSIFQFLKQILVQNNTGFIFQVEKKDYFPIIILSISVSFALPTTSCPSLQPGAKDVAHQTHLRGSRGPHIKVCTNCHIQPPPALVDYRNCDPCHSPHGLYDGVNDPVIGAKTNWRSTKSAIYSADGRLKPGKEKWCLGCHDDDPTTADINESALIGEVYAPGIAGVDKLNDHWHRPRGAWGTIGSPQKLIDGDEGTGNSPSGGCHVVFDLGCKHLITDIQMYVGNRRDGVFWKVYAGNDGTNWTRILGGATPPFSWKTGHLGQGWYQTKMDIYVRAQYLKIVKQFGPIVEDTIFEVRYRRDNLSYGYYKSGHGIRCSSCHDLSSNHIDGVTRTYQANGGPILYKQGYRLKWVTIKGSSLLPLEIPRTGLNWKEYPRTGNDFALCFQCHDKYSLLGDASGDGRFFRNHLETNFRNGTTNNHIRHLRGRGRHGNERDWDSDWDGTPDSPISCPACHNVHGSPTPAMIRHGELISTTGTMDKVPALNFRYIDASGDPISLEESMGGQTYYWGRDSGSVSKNGVCNMCHNDYMRYKRKPTVVEMFPGPQSHKTHIKDHKGPHLTCKDCHYPGVFTRFSDGQPLANTQTCDTCHSPGGSFDGVDDPEIGARVNWLEGIYDRDTFKPGKDRWCVTCHDDGTSSIWRVAAPNVAGFDLVSEWKTIGLNGGSVYDYNGMLQTDRPWASFSHPERLIDGDTSGIPDAWCGGNRGKWIVLDLGAEKNITDVRVYFAEAAPYFPTEITLGTDPSSCEKPEWGIRLTNWSWGETMGYKHGKADWYEFEVDKSPGWIIARYIKIRARHGYFGKNRLYELQYKENDITYGYYSTGHAIDCQNCHDPSRNHIDGDARTYQASMGPVSYKIGYRLRDIDGVENPVNVPRIGVCLNPQTNWQDFALCFTCHNRFDLLGNPSSSGNYLRCVMQTNLHDDRNGHLYHLKGHGPAGRSALACDTDLDGVNDSAITCTVCHNVHGSRRPAMTRTGELSGKDYGLNIKYVQYERNLGTPQNVIWRPFPESVVSLEKSIGGIMVSDPSARPCIMCHSSTTYWQRDPIIVLRLPPPDSNPGRLISSFMLKPQ